MPLLQNLVPLAPPRAAVAHVCSVALLGPAGSWTHQACTELWPGGVELHLLPVDAMAAALRDGAVQAVCLPARTRLVGATPYAPVLEQLLALPGVERLAVYLRMLGYALMGQAGMPLSAVRRVLAHPVALREAAPWLDRCLPWAERVPCASGGAAAQHVAQQMGAGRSGAQACLGAPLAARLYGLQALAIGIEEGPHNVTEWWVVGRLPPLGL